MNHKLHVLVSVDPDPLRVTVEVTGCLTLRDCPSLLHILKRAGRFGAGTRVSINLRNASHLDPEVLLVLRKMAATATATGQLRVSVEEPAELPLCLHHSSSGGEATAGPGATVHAGVLFDAGLEEACSPMATELESVGGLALSGYFKGSRDPVATVRALSDAALYQLADALYRHLDTASPSYGAHTWYELAAEEIQYRRRTDIDGPAEGECAAGSSRG